MDSAEYARWRVLREVEGEEAQSKDGSASTISPKKLVTDQGAIARWFSQNP